MTLVLQSLFASEFYVSPGGDDTNPGSQEKPFASLECARDAARLSRPSTVILKEGIYRISRTLELDVRDSGTIFQGHHARISGSVAVPPQAVKPVTDPQVLVRLLPEVRGKVLEFDLRSLGVNHPGEVGPRGFKHPYLSPPVELCFDGVPLTISQWPKADQPGEPIGSVLDDGTKDFPRVRQHGATITYATDRPSRWTGAESVWITGFFLGYAEDTMKVKAFDLAAKTLTTEVWPRHRFQPGKPWDCWTALNLVEEISLPGEYAVEQKSGKLYFLPPAGKDPARSQIEVSVLKDPMVSITGASGVILDGIDFGCSRGVGVYIEGGAGNRIRNAEFCGLGIVGAVIGRVLDSSLKPGTPAGGTFSCPDGPMANSQPQFQQAGTNNGLEHCRIHDTGAGGVLLGGGDRKSLTPAGNFVDNCDIHHFNRWDRSYRGAVKIDGVGNRISHCLLHDSPGSVITLHGNDHLIEYNEIHHAVMKGNDMGAFYTGKDPTERGNIIRYNYWHDLAPSNSTHCIYLDDSGGDGTLIFGNVFRNAGHLSTVNINRGSDVTVENNIFIDCRKPVRMGIGGAIWMTKDGLFDELLKTVEFDRSPWRDRYPQLLTYAADRPKMPKENLICKNLCVNSPLDFKEVGLTFLDNLSVEKDPGFSDVGIPGFQPIPFEKIGLEATK